MSTRRSVQKVTGQSGQDTTPGSGTVRAIFEIFEVERVTYCVTHGYRDLPHAWGSDIDIAVERHLQPSDIERMLTNHRDRLGAAVIYREGGRIVLASRHPKTIPHFIVLDLCHDFEFNRSVLLTGEELFHGRRLHNGIYVPAAAAAFQIELAKCVTKGEFGGSRQQRLNKFYAEDPSGVRASIAQRWPARTSALLLRAGQTQDWNEAACNSRSVARSLAITLAMRSPKRYFEKVLDDNLARVARILRPRGRHIAFLGPDGAGKSSTIEALRQILSPFFSRTEVRGFAPSLRQLLGRPAGSTSSPHGRAPRSSVTSLLRAAYWCLYALITRVSLRWAKTRSALILNDRILCDVLVDPVRYRYGGPRWALRLANWLSPKPDLLILLAGDPETIQARKRELSVAETGRLIDAYARLTARLPSRHVIDTGQPFETVVDSVAAAIIATLKH
jgi:thymidylate kinase